MALAAKKEWFGSGSRIVVTTRDKSVFFKFEDQFDCCLIHEVEELNSRLALQLFSKHAFRSNSPPTAFLRLSEEIIAKAGGLPLAIEVIGSFLCGKKQELVWQDTLKKMEYFQQKDVRQRLMLSYEALDDPQRQIFLDIACFLAGVDKSYPYYMWNDCGFFPNVGIDVLLLMSLVKIGENNRLWMHDQLKDLGKSIVYEEHCKDPTKGSRFWQDWGGDSDIFQQKGTKTVAAQYSRFRPAAQVLVLTSEELNKMPNIRFLHMGGCALTLSGDSGDLFSELRWLTWWKCPEEMQATNFCPKNLVILDLWHSNIDERWGGWTQLKVLWGRLLKTSISWEKSGTWRWIVRKSRDSIPFFLAFATVCSVVAERLILNSCRKLTKLSDSIGMLKHLTQLEISDTSIAEVPNTIVNLNSLKVLKMNNSLMRKLPEAIGMMEKLEEIYGERCSQLEMIPSDIVRLQSLKILKLTETCVVNVPKLPESLVSLSLSSTVSEKDPEISNLLSLQNLELCFPLTDIVHSSILKRAPHISNQYCKLELFIITSISSYLGCFRCLKELELKNCDNLCYVGQLPSDLREFTVDNCRSLEVVDLSDLSNFKNLKYLKVWGCSRLVEIRGLDKLESLGSLFIKCCSPLLCLPDLSTRKELRKWDVDALVTYSARGKQVARSDDLPLKHLKKKLVA
ncbi:hypothetical protein BT93_C1019 [Corymbia citriodora subsp. variegata]|nr:hypothetical protein BT93_C1019 [Corymbia citriodora subsp. variegata]